MLTELDYENTSIEISLFKNRWDNEPRHVDMSLAQLHEKLTTRDIREEKDGELWSPAVYEGGYKRAAANVLYITALVLDMDDGSRPGNYEWKGYHHIVYTSHSHTEAHAKWRIVLPFASFVNTVDWATVYPKLAQYFVKGGQDASCKDPSRIYYTPSCPRDRAGASNAWVGSGKLLDPDDPSIPPYEPPPEVKRRRKSLNNAIALGKGDYSTLDAVAMFQHQCHYGKYIGGAKGRHTVLCPWYMEHSDADPNPDDSATVIMTTPRSPDDWPGFKCWHSHCEGRTMQDVISIWPCADQFCSQEFQPCGGSVEIQRPTHRIEASQNEEDEESSGDHDESSEKKKKGPSDYQVAEDFASDMTNRMLYAEGDQWFCYNPIGAWQKESKESVECRIQRWMRDILGMRAGITSRRIKETMYLAREMMGPISIEDFDKNPLLIPMQNGVYDVETGDLGEHAPSRLLTRVLPYPYDPEAQAPRFLKFMAESMRAETGGSLIEWEQALFEWMGYCLIADPNTAQAAMLWIGDGGNGKGVLARVIEGLVGEGHHTAVSLENLHEDYHRASLFGKYAGFINEPSSRAMQKNADIFKAIVGGDLIMARHPYEKPFSFRALIRLMILCNKLPSTRDLSYGYFRRLVIIEWRNRPLEPDTRLNDKLAGEYPGIFNICIERGLKPFRERRFRFDALPESDRVKQEYAVDENPVAQFVEHGCDIGPEHSCKSEELYREFVAWCSEFGVKEMPTAAQFHQRLGVILRNHGLHDTQRARTGGRNDRGRIRFGISIASSCKDVQMKIGAQG